VTFGGPVEPLQATCGNGSAMVPPMVPHEVLVVLHSLTSQSIPLTNVAPRPLIAKRKLS
jgi:hypothetical protein